MEAALREPQERPRKPRRSCAPGTSRPVRRVWPPRPPAPRGPPGRAELVAQELLSARRATPPGLRGNHGFAGGRPSLSVQARAEPRAGFARRVGGALGHHRQGLQKRGVAQRLRHGGQVVHRGLEEFAHRQRRAREGLFDDGLQTPPGGPVLVAARAGDVLPVVGVPRPEGGVRVDAEHEQFLEGDLGRGEGERVAALVGAHLHPAHGQVHAGAEVLHEQGPLGGLQVGVLARAVESLVVQLGQLLARGPDVPVHGIHVGAGAHGRPVVGAEAHPAAHQVVGDSQVVLVARVEVGHIQLGRVGEGQQAVAVVLREHHHGFAVRHFPRQGRGSGDADEERRERPQQFRGPDDGGVAEVDEGLALAPVLGQVEKVPAQQGLRVGVVGVDARRGQLGSEQGDAVREVLLLGQVPAVRDAVRGGLHGKGEVPVEGVEILPEGQGCPLQGVEQDRFEHAPLDGGAQGIVEGLGHEFGHPVEHFELALGLDPLGHVLAQQVVREGLPPRTVAHRGHRAEGVIQEVELQFQPAQPPLEVRLEGGVHGEVEFLGELGPVARLHAKESFAVGSGERGAGSRGDCRPSG